MTAEHVIATSGMTRMFGRQGPPVVDDVNLRVARGGVYAFLGPNGAGKSTSIRMLLGLLRPTRGEVALFGCNLREQRADILARVGSLVENPSVYEHLTARENLEIPRRILDAPKSDIDRVLGIVGLENAARNLVRTFSLGMKQRLGIAQALLGRRELLILDEPTNGLDPAGMQEMRSLIQNLPGRHGVTVFLSSHLLSEVEQVATHVGILSQGALVFQGTFVELQQLRQATLRIGVRESESARAYLHQRGWDVKLALGSGGYLIASETGAVAAMNQALVQGGFEVHHLAVESLSLEEVFLSMTRAKAA